MFCKHDWKVLSEITTKSKVEHYISIGGAIEGKIPFDCMERKHIQVFTCTKCGKAKRFVEDI
jgi:hypothetical protein